MFIHVHFISFLELIITFDFAYRLYSFANLMPIYWSRELYRIVVWWVEACVDIEDILATAPQRFKPLWGRPGEWRASELAIRLRDLLPGKRPGTGRWKNWSSNRFWESHRYLKLTVKQQLWSKKVPSLMVLHNTVTKKICHFNVQHLEFLNWLPKSILQNLLLLGVENLLFAFQEGSGEAIHLAASRGNVNVVKWIGTAPLAFFVGALGVRSPRWDIFQPTGFVECPFIWWCFSI